jgi:membrane protease YdiL (CAAX protease family)
MGFMRRIGYDPKHINTYVVLLSAPILLSIYRSRGAAENFGDWFPGFTGHPLEELLAVLYQWAAFFILVGLIPAVYAHMRMKTSIRDLGGGLGDKRFGSIIVAFTLPLIILPLAYISSQMPEIIVEYPLAKVLFTRPDMVIWYELAYILIYYIAWEFYFRGFLLFSLERAFGGVSAILIQTISSALVHIGKPEGELMGAIVAGVVFGALALRTRSFWYGFIIHASLGVFVDLFVLMG